jgi:hypothetical protein
MKSKFKNQNIVRCFSPPFLMFGDIHQKMEDCSFAKKMTCTLDPITYYSFSFNMDIWIYPD